MSPRLAIYPVEVIFWLQLSSGLRWWIVDLAWLSVTMCFVLLKHVSSAVGWGLGVGVFWAWLGLILVVRRQVCVSQPGMGGLWPGHCWRDYPCIKYRCRHLSHSHSASIASPPSPPPPSLISPSPGSCSVMNSPYSPANDCLWSPA